MIIRNVRPHDNERLLELERHAPQGDAIRLLSERKDYFVRAERFDDPIMMVAEDENSGNILGVMGVAPVIVSLGGKQTFGGLIFDWRSNQQVVNGLPLHMYRLWQAVSAEVAARRLHFIFGYVKHDNARSLNIVMRSGATVIEVKEFLTIPVHQTFSRHPDWSSVLINPEIDAGLDWAAVSRAYAGRDLLPATDDRALRQRLADKYVEARVSIGGSSLKIWNSSGDYTHRVVHTPRLFRVARPIFGAFSHLMPLPHIPCPGEEIREWHLFDLVINRTDDLPLLLEKTRLLACSRGVDYLIICLSRQEEFYDSLSRYAWLKLKYNLVFKPISDVGLPDAPTYFDVRYI